MTTAEGVFRLLDRASRPLREMERQALRTDAAFSKLGFTMDAVGGPKTIRNYEQLDRQMRSMQRTERNLNVEHERTVTSVRKVNREYDGMWARIRRIGISIASVGKIISLFKFPAILAGVGLLVQAVGALAGGVVALTPRVADLAGVMAALPGILIGVGLAAVTAKLAFSGLSKAMSGNKEALKNMTPEAKRLIDTLRLYKPVVKELREAAQGGLFAGVDFAIRRLQRGVPMIERLLGRYSRTLGGLATRAARGATTPEFMRQFEELGNQGTFIIERMGTGIGNLVHAVLDLAIAARPFTRWIVQTITGWTQWARGAAEAGRQSGRLQAWLHRTQVALTSFGHITRDVWFTLRNLGRAARPLGDDLWQSAEKATAGWRRFTGSIEGRMKFIGDFAAMGEGIHEMIGLVGDLGQAIWRMGTSPGLGGMVRSLRELVPILEHVLTVVTAAFGPPIIAALISIGRLIENLSGATGPFVVFLRALTGIVDAFNWLLDHVPGLGALFSAALSVIAINLFIGKVQSLAASWWAVASGAQAAAAAQVAATGGAAGAGGLGALGTVGAGAAAGRWVRGAGGAMTWETGAAAGAGAGLAARGGLRGLGGAGRLGLGARAVGKFALPVMAIMAAIDAIRAEREGNVGEQTAQTIGAAISGATLGIVPPMQTPSQKRERDEMRYVAGTGYYTKDTGSKRDDWTMLGKWASGEGWHRYQQSARMPTMRTGIEDQLRLTGALHPTNRAGVAQQLKVYQQFAARARTLHGTARDSALAALQPEIDKRKVLLGQLNAEFHANQRLIRQKKAEQSIKVADTALTRMGERFNVDAQRMGPEAAMSKVGARTTRLMGVLDPAGRRVLAQNVLKWAAEARRQNPKLSNEYVKLNRDIKAKFADMGERVRIVNSKILTGSKTQWRQIRQSLIMESQLAKIGLAQNFAQIKQMAIGSLTAMGYTAKQAQSIVGGVVAGRPGGLPQTPGQKNAAGFNAATGAFTPTTGARGGRIPGSGLHDTVPLPGTRMIAAPGELVVNRHSERKADAMLGPHGLTLAQIVAGEKKKHSDILPGLARGGRVVGSSSALISEANRISAMNSVYKYGGGHVTPAPGTPPWDCSSSVSRLLQAAGVNIPTMVSGQFMGYGKPGPGWLTVYANPGHVYTTIGGHAWGTSTSRPGGGPGWFSGGARPGFAVRHVPMGPGGGLFGMPGAVGGLNLTLPPAHVGGIPGMLETAGEKAYAAGLSNKVAWGGWHGAGGSFVARRPTLIGVGERGPEPVHIGGSSTGGHRLTVHIGTIQNHREGDIQREIERAIHKVADHLFGATMESEQKALS